MSVCAHRPETPGFFKPCHDCKCGTEVRTELETETPRESAGLRPNDNGGRG